QEIDFPYSTTCTASNGTPPYSFVTMGVPAGLTSSTTSNSITISGSPSVSGQVSYTVFATDATPTQVSQQFNGTIAAHPSVLCNWTIFIYAIAGQPYTSPSCTVTGGAPPFHNSTTTLPAGLNVSFTNSNTFVVTGTPTASVFQFDVAGS